MVVGLAAIVFSTLYFVSDVVEQEQGGFSADFPMMRKCLLGIKRRGEG